MGKYFCERTQLEGRSNLMSPSWWDGVKLRFHKDYPVGVDDGAVEDFICLRVYRPEDDSIRPDFRADFVNKIWQYEKNPGSEFLVKIHAVAVKFGRPDTDAVQVEFVDWGKVHEAGVDAAMELAADQRKWDADQAWKKARDAAPKLRDLTPEQRERVRALELGHLNRKRPVEPTSVQEDDTSILQACYAELQEIIRILQAV